MTYECHGDAICAGDGVKNFKLQSGRGKDDVDYSGFECRDSAVNVAELVTGSGDYGRYITSVGDSVQRKHLCKTAIVHTLPGSLPGWPQSLSQMGTGKSPTRLGTILATSWNTWERTRDVVWNACQEWSLRAEGTFIPRWSEENPEREGLLAQLAHESKQIEFSCFSKWCLCRKPASTSVERQHKHGVFWTWAAGYWNLNYHFLHINMRNTLPTIMQLDQTFTRLLARFIRNFLCTLFFQQGIDFNIFLFIYAMNSFMVVEILFCCQNLMGTNLILGFFSTFFNHYSFCKNKLATQELGSFALPLILNGSRRDRRQKQTWPS